MITLNTLIHCFAGPREPPSAQVIIVRATQSDPSEGNPEAALARLQADVVPLAAGGLPAEAGGAAEAAAPRLQRQQRLQVSCKIQG